MRGGWWGNLFLDSDIGSKLWLLNQAPNNTQTLSNCLTYVQTALQWLIDDSYADNIDTTGESTSNGRINFTTTIYKDGSIIDKQTYSLWENTLNG